MCDALITEAKRLKWDRNRSAVTAAAAVGGVGWGGGGISQLWSYANSASECEISPDKRRKRVKGGREGGEGGVGAASNRGGGVQIEIARESWGGRGLTGEGFLLG